MPRKKPAPVAKPPEPARSHPAAQTLVAKILLRVAERHDDDTMRAAGVQLAKVAKRRPGRSD